MCGQEHRAAIAAQNKMSTETKKPAGRRRAFRKVSFTQGGIGTKLEGTSAVTLLNNCRATSVGFSYRFFIASPQCKDGLNYSYSQAMINSFSRRS